MKYISFIAFTFLIAAATACQKDVCLPMENPQDGVMIFDVLSPGVQSKATGNMFASGDKAGIFVTDYVDDTTPMPLQVSGNRATNIAIVCDGSSWNPEKPVYWGDTKSDVYAYYPYTKSITDIDGQAWKVATDQTVKGQNGAPGAYESSDVLWAKAEGVSRSGGAVTLAMKHIMSKLTVKIVAGEDYVGSLPDDAKVFLHSTVTSAVVNLEKGSATKDPYGKTESIKMRNLGIRNSDGVKAIAYDAIVVPQMLKTSVPFIEIVSDSVSYLLEDSFNFRPGVAYTYTVTLNASATSIKVEIGCDIDGFN